MCGWKDGKVANTIITLGMALIIIYSALPAAAAAPRALWLWNGDILFERAELEQFLDFVQAPHGNDEHRIELVFLSIRGGFTPATWPRVMYVIGRLHEVDVVVHALTGDPAWALEHSTPLLYLQHVLDYNAQAPVHQRIQGVQFDVEPYLLRDKWDTAAGFQEIKAGFIELLTKLQAFRNGQGSHLQIGVAIPRWYDQAAYEFLNEAIQARSDYVAIMNYWNAADRLIRDAEGELSTADALGKNVYIGVEVQQIEPATITFYGYTVAEMEAVLSQAEAAFAQHESYRGLVIHHYTPYRAMMP